MKEAGKVAGVGCGWTSWGALMGVKGGGKHI